MTKKYTKTEWVDEELVEDARYDILDSDGNPIYEGVEIALATDVITAATPANAEKLNNIENGIDEIDDLLNVDGITTDNINPSILSGDGAVLATVAGSLAQDKQLTFDADGNIVASSEDVGGGGAWGEITGTLSDQTDLLSGWIGVPFACSYSSADAPIFVISAAGDVTGYIGVGDRIKLTQSTGGTKYFIVHAVGNYSGGATLLTVYGGTDFTLNNEAISSPYFGHAGTPIGFPKNPNKWSVNVADTTQRSQANPTALVWYNLGGVSISLPIGIWRVKYKVAASTIIDSTGADVYTTLSTSNNSESDVDMTAGGQSNGANASPFVYSNTFRMEKIIAVTSKTTYYLNTRCLVSNATIYNQNQIVKLIISAECAYL